MKKILTAILILTVLAAGLLMAGCSGGSSGTTTTQEYAKVGEVAPNFELKDISGNTISLKSFRGKPVFINFWATYCGPCVDEMPLLQQVYDERADDGLVMLVINSGEDEVKAGGFIERNGYTFTVPLDKEIELAMSYGVQYLPTTFLIDRDGILLAIKIGAFRDKATIDSEFMSQVFP